MLNAVSGVDHLERPAYRTELDLLQQNLGPLANGARQMLVVLQLLVRTVGIVVILALVFPPLGLLPLLAIAPLAGERASVRLRQGVDERLAADRRLADQLFELATSAGPAKELRVFGVTGALRERHQQRASVITERHGGRPSAAALYGALRLARVRGRVRRRYRRSRDSRRARPRQRRAGGARRDADPAQPSFRSARPRHRSERC